MKPVLILQHMSSDGPAYLADWLLRRGVRFEVLDTEAGQAFPARIEGWGALAVLGGEMSANDPLPSLRDAERLILDAMAQDVPVIGHCLGGQLMARALGARVLRSPAPEIGWQPVRVEPVPQAPEWFGTLDEAVVFQWHHDAFELPRGAQRLASSAACGQQAFVIGPHLGLQFHVEIDATKLEVWSASTDPHFLALQGHCATVQSGAQMRAQAGQHLAAQQRLADAFYARWLSAAR
jgi:GMP synthase (glutamine-hydrolysing)